ncbi:MAG: SDR family oxidoreductase [Anaerolineae bacterium]
MDLYLKDKVALVAASSRGLGKAVAMELAREGAALALSARGADTLQTTAEEIRQATGSRVLAVPADVSTREGVATIAAAALEAFSRVDILVNNAGGPKPGRFTDVSDEDWLAAVNLNLMSAVRLIQHVLPGMRERRWGRIIQIASVSVKQPMPNLILSNAVRSAVVAMAKTLSGQVAAEGITVNNVCPGYHLTDRMRNLAQDTAKTEGRSPQDVIDAWEADIPARRLGRPEELAALVAFLASERAAYITGATIQVDGGAVRGLL